MATEAAKTVSRVARLVDLTSKPELNGKLVHIDSLNEETQRYSVRTFTNPNIPRSSTTFSVKRINLELIAPSFEEVHSAATAVEGLHPFSTPAGTIHDISKHPIAAVNDVPIIIDNSRSIRGASYISSENGRPTTRVTNPILVIMDDDPDDVVEFVDIYFNRPVNCEKGRNIVFRRCKFHSLDAGCGIGGPDTHVIFENCFFEDLKGSGLIVECGGHATLVDCNVCRTSLGIEIRNGGSAHALNCTISDTKLAGVAVTAKGLSLTMEMCTILRSKDSGILVMDGGELRANDCLIQDCAIAGAAIEGPSRSIAQISSTVFTGCLDGMLVQTGKSAVTVEHSQMLKNRRYGLFVGEDAVGEIVVNDCVITDNRMRDINNDGGRKSSVIRNGTILAQDGIMANLARTNPVAAQRIMQNVQRHMKQDLGDKIVLQNPSLTTARARKMAGVGSVNCAACNQEEPLNVKFRKCSRCLDMCYCSRECQVAHWEVHKGECIKRVKYPQLLNPSQSVNDR